MGGKSKNMTIIVGTRVKEIAAIVSAGRGDKQPKLAGMSSLTNQIMNQTGPDPVVHTTNDDNSKQCTTTCGPSTPQQASLRSSHCSGNLPKENRLFRRRSLHTL